MDNTRDILKKITDGVYSPKNELIKDLEKKLKTSFIFPIAELERLFGHLWKGSPDDEIEGPEYYQELFNIFRKSVLDNGNNQIRNLGRSLEVYERNSGKDQNGKE